MAAEVSTDLNIIHDEDVLRRMWQQTDDFGRKKEIRQRMYKLREQRLRDFYTGDNSDMTSRKHTSNTYTDSIEDQGFMSLKSKEIRDSESPTRDIHRHQGDNNYWNTVQQSSYNDDGGVKSYERSSKGSGQSADGATKLRVDSDERGFSTSNTSETENAKTISDRQQHDAQISAASHTKTDAGEAFSYSTSQEHQESSSSVTESKDCTSAYKSNKWETSSVSSSSSRKVISSSKLGKLSSDVDLKVLTSGDGLDFSNTFNPDEDLATSTTRRIKSTTYDNKKYRTAEESQFDGRSDSRNFIDSETRNNIKNNFQDIRVSIIDDHFGGRDSRRDSISTYASDVTSNVDDYTSQKDISSSKRVNVEMTDTEKNNTVVDQNIMSEINKLDSFLSTQNTGTNTPASPRSVMGEANWTIVSNNDGDFVYKDDNEIVSSGPRATPMKQPDNLDLPKECTESQYMTTYNEHYTSKRISVDVSPTHDKFARSLRQTPPGTPRSLSRQSLDRSSPERKSKPSPRSSPDKEQRTSIGSYTIERPSSARRKSSEVTRQTATSRDSTLKTKRKFSTTQNKATTKVRTSTPGTSPSTSPSRKPRDRSQSTSSASDSDASQVTNDKKPTSNTHKRADIVRRNLMNEFDKDTVKTQIESTQPITNSSSRPSSPEKSVLKQTSTTTSPNNAGISRKESVNSSKMSVKSTTEQTILSGITPHMRETSPEYSSEGSVGKEIKSSQMKTSPDSSPERTAFTPIKQFRTSPEVSSQTIQVTATESDRVTNFIKQEQLNTQTQNETIDIGVKKTVKLTDDESSLSPNPKEPEIKVTQSLKQSKHEKEKSPSSVEKTNITRKNSYTRKDSTSREKSPQKEETYRPQSPAKSTTPTNNYISQRSQSPEKEQQRTVSPTKGIMTRKSSVVARTPSPSDKSRSPSPSKKDSVSLATSTSTTITRKSSLKKESSFKDTPSKKVESSPVKRVNTSRSPTPKRESPERRTQHFTGSPSPDKSTSRRNTSPVTAKLPSPQRNSNKRSHHLLSSPSVSPCSSPERYVETNKDQSKPIRKTSGQKSPERDTLRSTRRSSIPRSEQSTVRRKVETKIEIKSKPITKTQSLPNKQKSSSSLKMGRTDSQNSMDRTVTLKTYSSTTKKSIEKPSESIKKSMPPSRKIVTTTAVISLQKPTATSQVRHNTSSTVTRTSTFNRTSSKEITPKNIDNPTNKKPTVTTNKRIASRTNTPKSHTAYCCDEIDRSVTETNSNKVTSQAFIQQLKNNENKCHGFKDEILNLEITDLEDETRPELYPETEEDEESVDNKIANDISDVNHKTEKSIHLDSKRKAASQIMITLKKPTATPPSKPSTRPVTTRSSSGPVKGTPQTVVKSTKIAPKRQENNAVQKCDSLSMIRTKSDKNISKTTTPQKRQISKPDMLAGNTSQISKAGSTRQVTETGIASRNVTTAKATTVKRNTPIKKRPSDTHHPIPSSSDDEGQNIPSVVTPNHQEQKYIEELEEMRQNEELEYASKLTATTNQENQLLSVIIQHPKSSRESSPDMSNKLQPFCTVSDDGGANPRYADVISEPEDVDVFNPKYGPTHERYTKTQPRFEQVTDLDEESEVEEIKLNVSVADRVTHFLEESKNHVAVPIREESENQSINDGAKNVLKAAAMFETIAKNQTVPPAPDNKAPDILSRPSVFEARKGQIAPKPAKSDFVNKVEPQADRHGLIQTNNNHEESIDIYKTNQSEVTQLDKNSVSYTASTNSLTSRTPVKKIKESSTLDKIPSPQNGPINNEQNEKSPKTDPTSRIAKNVSTPSFDKKKQDSPNKSRPFEKTISASAEISSKRAFFERKAQTDTSSKPTKLHITVKERKPLTESVQNKENIRGPSPSRKPIQQTSSFIENERKPSRTSLERKPSTTSPERKTSRTSPERTVSRTSPERRSSTPAPAKERKHSIKSESPERKMSFTKSVKERRSSFTKEDITTSQTTPLYKRDSKTKVHIERKTSPSRESPERRAPITLRNFPDHISKTLDISEQNSSSSVTDRKSSLSRESPERAPVRKSSRTSPERSQKSSDKSPSPQNIESDKVELNKTGKFGVALRRTSSTTSTGAPRKTSTSGDTQEIEDITDLSLLEIMMEKAVGYEQRRRIRTQIRIVKKNQEDQVCPSKTTRQKSPTRSPSKQLTQETTESKKPERRPSSPTKSYQERVTVEQKTVRKISKPLELQPKTPEPKQMPPKPEQPLTNGYRSGSPGRLSKDFTTEKEGVQGIRKTSRTEVEVSSSVRSQKRVETLVESGVDCITSSYGVGPTDENGRPLFGLRALRRTNTNKQLTDDLDSGNKVVEEVRQEIRTERTEEVVRDNNGRPLFGGLRALRARDTRETDSDTDLSDMPEQTSSTQLRELVQRHEKVVSETNGPQDQPRQKPRAKLRDSFILTDDEGKDQQTESHLSEVNSLNRGLSLKSIIQKHENIATTGGIVRSEVESSHTVVSSRTAVSSDGTVSHSRDVIQGELSAKNGEEPVGKVTRSQYTYKSPKGDDEGVNQLTTTTTTLAGRRTSGPKITEVEEYGKTTKRSSVTEETLGTKIRKSSLKKVQRDEEKSDRRCSSQEDGEITKTSISKVASTAQRFTTDDSKSIKSSSAITTTSSPTLTREKSSEVESVDEKKKTLVRGDSVRALQHKFQQATENSANSVSSARNTPARAGLILRTSSFTSSSQPHVSQDPVSSTLKQSTTTSAERKSGRQSPEKRRDSPTSDTSTVRRESLSKSSTDERRESLTTTRITGTSSFLDNTTKVTGVQDILTRMKNADLVSESGDTDTDREARALLNKFLGASVILQGLEQGARNANLSETTPGSAALVSSVEKQRVATTRQKEEDIESIWDEQVLKNLLEQCTDYDGRRKLRARLRTVMAEHKACADLVALTGDSVANSGECRSPIDDSGTESGEDFRLLSPEILAEVQSALIRLEAALPGLDPVRREALIRLVNRLQSCLKLQPASQTSTPSNPPPPQPPPPQHPVRRYANRRQRHQRHTVGVSKEELADARRWLQETRQQSAASTEAPSVESCSSTNLNEIQEDIPKPVHQVFRPVIFNPNQSREDTTVESVNQLQTYETSESQEEPKDINLTSPYHYPQDVTKADSGSSLLEYDPSLTLFTPSQSVQIAVHKAAINKQISEEESKRGNSKREERYDSEDGDISSVEEDHSLAMGQDGLEDAISSAQRLLQIATDNKNTANHGRFQDRSSKKQKMKRANTIDIPKPANAYGGFSLDEFGMPSGHMKEKDHKYSEGEHKNPPQFEPKTESDLKFLAFLQKANNSSSEAKAGIYNPSARGGQPWTNRFVNIKTAFEKPTENKQTTQSHTEPPPITQNWLNNSSKPTDPVVMRQGVNRTPQPLQAKLPWTTREEVNGVVVGSLTVKPSPLKVVQKPLGPVNKFSHAPKSAFKPIEKKPLTQVHVFEPTKITVSKNSVKPFHAIYTTYENNNNNKGAIKQVHQQMKKTTSSASGSVKQLATQKFSGENIPSKPIIKQYPAIQDKQFNSANIAKQHPLVEQISKPPDKSKSVKPSSLPPPQFSSSIASTQKQLFDQSHFDSKIVKITQSKTLKEFKDGTKFSPPKQFINSPPPLNKQHSDPIQYPTEGINESSESRQVTTKTEGNSFTRTEVHTRTSTNRLTKASSVSSPFAKFKQLERQNSAPSVGAAPLFRVTDPRVARSASSIKDRLLSWVQAQTREYKNIQIENFSTSWNNGLAFCALIHHFCPNAFDYDQLTPEKRRHNFELAFRVAEEEADIAPLLDVEDMVVMRRPDWKCVFTYVQSVYRRFHSTPEAVRC